MKHLQCLWMSQTCNVSDLCPVDIGLRFSALTVKQSADPLSPRVPDADRCLARFAGPESRFPCHPVAPPSLHHSWPAHRSSPDGSARSPADRRGQSHCLTHTHTHSEVTDAAWSFPVTVFINNSDYQNLLLKKTIFLVSKIVSNIIF